MTSAHKRASSIVTNTRRRLRGMLKQVALYNMSGLTNPFFDHFIGGNRRPIFFDIDTTYPALRVLDRCYPAIKAELEGILPARHRLPRYHEIDSDLIYASGRFDRDKNWNVFMLYSYGAKPASNRRLCPQTCAALDSIPNLVQAFFSILEGGKSIPAHNGPTRAYLRYHLGLKVPAENPPYLRLEDQYYTWKEGESVLFDDSWNHEVCNKSADIRVVLLVDVLRPLPAFPHAVNYGLHQIGKLFYGRRILKNANAHKL